MKHFLISRFSLPTRVTGLPSLLFHYSLATSPASLYLPLALARHTAACLRFFTLFNLATDSNKEHNDGCRCSCCNREHYLLVQITSNLHHRPCRRCHPSEFTAMAPLPCRFSAHSSCLSVCSLWLL